MKFKTSITGLSYWLERVKTGLGNKLTKKEFFFDVEDGFVTVACSNGTLYSKVVTTIVPEVEGKFNLDAESLISLVVYAEEDGISFEQKGSGVEIFCGTYRGEWSSPRKDAEFPESVGEVLSQPYDLSEQGKVFLDSINRVKYASPSSITFRDGLCWASSGNQYQHVVTGFPVDVDVVVTPSVFEFIKFLKINPDFKLKISKTKSRLFFYDGKDVFSCPGAGKDKEEKDDRKLFMSKIRDEQRVYFSVETELLSRALARAGITSEVNSAIISFKLSKDEILFKGVDKHGNFGEDFLSVNVEGNTSLLPIEKRVGWTWVTSALSSSGDKSVTLNFDEHFCSVDSGDGKSVFALRNPYGV